MAIRYQYPFRKPYRVGTPFGQKGTLWKSGYHSGLDLISLAAGGDGKVYPVAPGSVFQSINAHDGDGLLANCEDILSSLLGKNSAPKSDVVTFMDKLYKEDVANMNWHINNDYQIKKREIGDSEYEYQVVFTAKQVVDKTDGSKHEQLFKISSTVSPDLKISSFNMSKVTPAQ